MISNRMWKGGRVTVMDDFRQLLSEISHCSVADAIRSGSSPVAVPCHKIVGLQTGSLFQLPEPWSGQIDIARLLFISSNPSINELEEYPEKSWELHRTTDFFHNRFTSPVGWVVDRRALLRNGLRSDSVRFWGAARDRTAEILQKGRDAVKPGIDFALTEVVHCKSKKERGVSEALHFCSERYLERVLFISAAKVLIVYGRLAKDAVHRRFDSLMSPLPNGLSLVSIRDNPRILVFLPHPNAIGPLKSLRDNVGDDGLSLIRAHLKIDI